MTGAYYNEFKPEAAHMLRQLIKDGLIAPGEVDERSITEVSSDDIKGFKQCHFFAGIGGWSVALRQAMWPDDRPVWTGSCPCQPFSGAGKQKGHGDERHLWPHWARLIRECRPSVIFGEQVAAAIAYGWWDEVAADLEAEGYACAAAVLPACSVGRPHRRDRLWFVADSSSRRCREPIKGEVQQQRGAKTICASYVAHTSNIVSNERGSENHSGAGGQDEGAAGTDSRIHWIACPDGKQRPVEPSICLLADGIQHRTPVLHAFGNAIVPQVAAEFIKAAIP